MTESGHFSIAPDLQPKVKQAMKDFGVSPASVESNPVRNSMSREICLAIIDRHEAMKKNRYLLPKINDAPVNLANLLESGVMSIAEARQIISAFYNHAGSIEALSRALEQTKLIKSS